MSGEGVEDLIGFIIVMFLDRFVRENRTDDDALKVLMDIVSKRFKVDRRMDHFAKEMKRMTGEFKQAQ